jgi:hypothetical protein
LRQTCQAHGLVDARSILRVAARRFRDGAARYAGRAGCSIRPALRDPVRPGRTRNARLMRGGTLSRVFGMPWS